MNFKFSIAMILIMSTVSNCLTVPCLRIILSSEKWRRLISTWCVVDVHVNLFRHQVHSAFGTTSKLMIVSCHKCNHEIYEQRMFVCAGWFFGFISFQLKFSTWECSFCSVLIVLNRKQYNKSLKYRIEQYEQASDVWRRDKTLSNVFWFWELNNLFFNTTVSSQDFLNSHVASLV
jgi:hypothetical protein